MTISMIRTATDGDAQRVVEIYNHYALSTTVTFEENVVEGATMAQRTAETTVYAAPDCLRQDHDAILSHPPRRDRPPQRGQPCPA